MNTAKTMWARKWWADRGTGTYAPALWAAYPRQQEFPQRIPDELPHVVRDDLTDELMVRHVVLETVGSPRAPAWRPKLQHLGWIADDYLHTIERAIKAAGVLHDGATAQMWFEALAARLNEMR